MSEEFQILLQSEAEEGRENAYYWIEKTSPQKAHKGLKGLMDAIASLKVFPRSLLPGSGE